MDDQNQEPKKGLPGNFVLFLIAAVFVLLMMQSFLDVKTAKVSFSYQLEHLVNLDLIQPEDSRKTAINDNLVTFRRKFRERLTDESKKRYKFLDLLNESHQYANENERLIQELKGSREKIQQSASLFLLLSGIDLPKEEGYVVVNTIGSPLENNAPIIVDKLPKMNTKNLKELSQEFSSLKKNPDDAAMMEFGRDLIALIRNFRSPQLGIGSEQIKGELRALEKEIVQANNADFNQASLIGKYQNALVQLQSIVSVLNEEQGNSRLNQLRSVRNFKEALAEYSQLVVQRDDNSLQMEKARQNVANVIWFFNNQELSTRTLEKQDPEKYSHWFTTAKEEWQNFDKNRGGFFKAPDQPLNTVLEKKFRSEEPPPKYLSYMFPALLAFAVVAVLYMLFARQMKGVGSGAMTFGKSPARLVTPSEDNKITFKDVAGVDEALEELEEIVDFLRSPKKFTSLGGRIPKGVLCIGPPGTGKTLIAKAVAGEANRPFFSISGSDFVEMFVGVGASRIRDLFEQAKKNSPCIIFIDEIDAVGRHRGAGIGGGHDEREQTLNQLLVEMDGFDTNEGVILMAATNRPDVLDKALLRPGRFDRRVIINLPDIKGRFEILKVHARKIKMDTSVDLMVLARGTPGCSGADLMNMLNEAALIAARRGRSAVTMQEIMEARDKVLYGKERRNLEVSEDEKRRTAYHESGHTIVGLCVEHADPIDKVTIIPRGMSLGATLFMPEKNRVSYWRKELIDQLAMLMGGRCAEEIFVGDISSGAKQDIEMATNLARSMVCEWGMSEKLGPVMFGDHQDPQNYSMGSHEKKYSEATAQNIDIEVHDLLEQANKRAHEIIEEKQEIVELMTDLLMEYETLDKEDLQILMERKWDHNEKKLRLKKAEELHKNPATPPPPPHDDEKENEDNTPPAPSPNQEGSAPA